MRRPKPAQKVNAVRLAFKLDHFQSRRQCLLGTGNNIPYIVKEVVSLFYQVLTQCFHFENLEIANLKKM